MNWSAGTQPGLSTKTMQQFRSLREVSRRHWGVLWQYLSVFALSCSPLFYCVVKGISKNTWTSCAYEKPPKYRHCRCSGLGITSERINLVHHCSRVTLFPFKAKPLCTRDTLYSWYIKMKFSFQAVLGIWHNLFFFNIIPKCWILALCRPPTSRFST